MQEQQKQEELSQQDPIKLDYSIESPQERTALVQKIIDAAPPERLTHRYLQILANYIIFAMTKKEKKQKTINTDNRMITVNKRQTSFEGLMEKFETGEDGVYNIFIENDKNAIFTSRAKITEQDIEDIPSLKQLQESIEIVKQAQKKATGKRKFNLKKQLIEMYKQQYLIKSFEKPVIHCSNLIKSFSYINFEENITIEKGKIKDNSLLSFFNPKHISALLCNYSKLKEESYGKFYADGYFLMEDLDSLIEKTLRDDYPLYYDLLIYKIDGKQNIEIQKLLYEKYEIKHSIEYISSLWRKKIPKLIAAEAEKEYLIWYYTVKEYGKWKKCSRCGQIKLAHNIFFSKNSSSKDGWYSICKCCRNKKKKKK